MSIRGASIAIVALLIASCVTSRPVMVPDGSQGHYIECPRSVDLCMDKAAELCPYGYNVIDSGGRHGAIAQTNYQTGQTIVTPTFRGNMTVSCRAPVATPPQSDRSVGCAPLVGTYAIRRTAREGTCGVMHEDLITMDLARNASDCRQVWPNGCGMNVDCKGDAHLTSIVRWNEDGTLGRGMERWVMSGNLPFCEGTYDVTYTRM